MTTVEQRRKVVSFHTVPAEELIEERPDEVGEGTTRRHYLG